MSIEIECLCFSGKKLYSLYDFIESQKCLFNAMKLCLKHNLKQIKYCPDCLEWLCSECLNNHSNDEPNHLLLLDNEINVKCSNHKLEYSSYCIQCKCHLCNKCLFNNDIHSQHKEYQIVPIPIIDKVDIERNYLKAINTLKTIQTIKNEHIIKLDSLIKESVKDNNKVTQLMLWKEELMKATTFNDKINSLLMEFMDLLMSTYRTIQYIPNYHLNKILFNIQINQLTFNIDSNDDNEVQYNDLFTMLYSFCIVTVNSDIRCVGILNQHTNYVNCIIELKDGTIATGSDDNTVKIWNVFTMIVIKSIKDLYMPINCLLQLKDERLLAGSYNSIYIWNLITLEENKRLEGHSDFIYSMIQLDNGLIATGARDSTIILWDEKLLSLKAILIGHKDPIYCLIQLDDRTLVSGSCDYSIMTWNIDTYKNEGILKGHKDSISSIIQLDDNTIASGSYDKSIKIWDLKSKSLLTSLIGHSDYLLCLIQLKNGNLLSSSCDNNIKLWDSMTFKCVLSLYVKHPVRCLIQLKNEQLACGSNKYISLYLI